MEVTCDDDLGRAWSCCFTPRACARVCVRLRPCMHAHANAGRTCVHTCPFVLHVPGRVGLLGPGDDRRSPRSRVCLHSALRPSQSSSPCSPCGLRRRLPLGRFFSWLNCVEHCGAWRVVHPISHFHSPPFMNDGTRTRDARAHVQVYTAYRTHAIVSGTLACLRAPLL